MDLKETVGYFGAIFTLLAGIPQLVRVLQTKSAEDISLLMLLIFLAGNTLWFFYGLMLSSVPIWVSNGFMGFVMMTIIFLKFKYQKAKLSTGK